MSQVRGTISVDVAFTDSTTVDGAQSLKTITLRDATEYATGKVAIVTGTCGTAAVTVAVAPTTYRDATGNLVSFATVKRVAAAGSQSLLLAQLGSEMFVATLGTGLAVSAATSAGPDDLTVRSTAGTASYTLVIYGT